MMRGEAKPEALAFPGNRQGSYAAIHASSSTSTGPGRSMPSSSPPPGSTSSTSFTRQHAAMGVPREARASQYQPGPGGAGALHSSGPLLDSHEKRYSGMRSSQSRQSCVSSGGLTSIPPPSRSGPTGSGPGGQGHYALTSPRAGHGSRVTTDPFAETLPGSVTVTHASGTSTSAPGPSRPDRARANAPSPAGTRSVAALPSRSGAARPSSDSVFPGPGHITVTDDAGALFRQMDASPLIHEALGMSGEGSGSPMSTAMRGPPPAGMRGALSWGVGPNAYESDGRPGTRGGGTMYDLEGRPLTRSGARPPSRMQLGQVGVSGSQQGPFSSPVAPGDRSGGGGGEKGFPTSPGTGSSAAAPPSAPPGWRGASGGQGSAAPSLQRTSGPPAHGMRLDSLPAAAGGLQGAGAGERGRPQPLQSLGRTQPLGGAGISAGAGGAPGPAAARGPQGHGGRPGAASQQQQPPQQVQQPPQPAARHRAGGGDTAGRAGAGGGGDDHDIDAFLDAMSDGEGGDGSGNLDDLRKYLNTLDQDKPASKAAPGAAGGKDTTAPTPLPNEPPVAVPGVPQHLTHLNHRAVRTALKVIDTMIAQAVRTAEVNALIAAAERKALLDDAQFGVALEGDNWQTTVRAAVSPLSAADEFGALSSAVAKSGSKLPDRERFAAEQAAEAEATARAAQGLSLPRDEFHHLGPALGTGGRAGTGAVGPRAGPGWGLGGMGPAGGRNTSSVAASLSSLPPDVLGSLGGMGRYAAHRL